MGPVGIFCVQRTLEKGRSSGFFTGIGASLSDLIYCLLTGFGLSFIEVYLKENQSIIQIIGSVVLILFGIYLFKHTPARKVKKPDAEKISKGKNVLSGFLFTFSNPLIIFLIIGLFARFDFFLPEISLFQYIIGYVSIVIGALSWWWLVSYFVDKVRAHFNLRSMWLINKIIGGIIMIFAVVGIVTGISGLASAQTTKVYLNSTRGFGELGTNQSGSPLILTNESHKETISMLPVSGSDDFEFCCRLANLNNESGKNYIYFDAGGKKMKVKNPSWALCLKNKEEKAFIDFRTSDRHTDDWYQAKIEIEYITPIDTGKLNLYEGVDLFRGENTYRVVFSDNKIALFGGNRKYQLIKEGIDMGFRPDSIGFVSTPGGKIQIDDVILSSSGRYSCFGVSEWSHMGDADVRESYFKRSSDPIEGEWEIFDRMLDEEQLRMGGNYRVAFVRTDDGYDMLYLDGAHKNNTEWRPGMIKARFHDTSFKNVFDISWLDPSGEMIEGEIKAQFEKPEIINIRFPGHGSSSVRFRKIK